MSKVGRSVKKVLGLGKKKKHKDLDLLDKKITLKLVSDIESNLYGCLGQIIDNHIKDLNKKVSSTKSKKDFQKFFDVTNKQFTKKMNEGIKKVSKL